MPVEQREARRATAAEPSRAAAELAVARFTELAPDIRGCAILGPAGILAASGERDRWEAAARELLAAADAAVGVPAAHAHVATEDGEAYAVRHGELAMVAVTDRFALASLVLADMRAALRDLAGAGARRGAEAA